ncbi:thioredoxin [Polyangium jinanense]|uniref:Thioredoxin n=1 Tax=Polyangium jinanense TaxID=2829994 RepID=A0A9X3XAK9_9BACT|nr:thioredoxin [Polyangium jinanense]MDC3954247.1 thioredoxin [Polyangium jinanense]MDC3984301.1 thioredoxin [Polyangium jinanense]
MPVPVISEQDFEREVLRSELPVLIDFYADWCGPCKTVAPEVEALSRELEGKAKFVKVNIDQSKRLAAAMRVQAVPTFMVFFRGRPVAGEQGAVRKARLRELLDPFLPRAEGAIRAMELAQALKQHQVVPVDTREAAAYNRAHIPGAVHIPLEEIETRLAELHMLPGEPVLYCRAGDKSKTLAETLAKSDVPIAFLENGFLGWEAEGLPIERPD